MNRLVTVIILTALVVGIAGCTGGDGDNGDGSCTLIVDFTAGGTVTVDDVPIPGKAILTYDPDTVVSLNATPSAGYRFVEWTGNVSTIDDVDATSTTIMMNADKSVTANFGNASVDAISVQTAWTVGWPENWDADAANDGLRIWVELLDSDETMIEYTGMSMPLQIALYSTESVAYPFEKSRLLYSGSGTLTDRDHDCFCTGAIGVKDIPWQDISRPLPSEDQDYGILHIIVTLPNGEDYTAEYSPIQIRNR
ncbi:hypothetical protein ACFLW7_03625 [Chloroflexota bacterium]